MPSNDHIINQMRGEALRFYHMGEPDGPMERVSIVAAIDAVTVDTVYASVLSPESLERKHCEFMRSEVIVQFYNAENAVVRIPKAYLPAFCLWKYELKGAVLELYEKRVAEHNAPLLRRSEHKPERVGSVRI